MPVGVNFLPPPLHCLGPGEFLTKRTQAIHADEPAPHIPPTRPADLQPPLLTIHSNHDSFLAGLYAAQDFFCAVDPDTCVSNGASLQDNISLPRAQLEAAINAAASLLSQMRQQNA
eukprot:1155990-Pelagomonas_calceolata.AAC.2